MSENVVSFPSKQDTITKFAEYCAETYAAFKAAGFDDERSYDLLCRVLNKLDRSD